MVVLTVDGVPCLVIDGSVHVAVATPPAPTVPVVGDTGGIYYTDKDGSVYVAVATPLAIDSPVHVAVATPPAPSVHVVGNTGGKLTVTCSLH